MNDLYSILSRQIKYLQMSINQLEQIDSIFERCQYLTVVKFEVTQTQLSAEVLGIIYFKGIDQSCQQAIFFQPGLACRLA